MSKLPLFADHYQGHLVSTQSSLMQHHSIGSTGIAVDSRWENFVGQGFTKANREGLNEKKEPEKRRCLTFMGAE